MNFPLSMSMSILIVDDETLQRKIIEYILKKRLSIPPPYIISHAIDGNDAVNKCLMNKYHIILMDITMPKCNGIDATKMIRMYDKNVRIFACTAADTPDIKELCDKSGMNGFFKKPFNQNYALKLDKLIHTST